MSEPQPVAADACHYCGNPIARTSLSFVHRRRAEQVDCRVRLCSACGDRVEYHLHIALSTRLLGPRTAVA